MTSNKSVWEPINEDDTLKTTKIDGERWALVEIVSALRVPKAAAADCGTKSGASNPYVIVTVAGKEMHRTDVCYSDPNPVWTIKTGSLFLLELNKDDDGGGDKKKVDPTTATVTFTINDCDATTEHQTVGTVKINLKDLINGKGRRKEYSVNIPEEIKKSNNKTNPIVARKSKLVLRFKSPSLDELHFIKTTKNKSDGVFAHETFLPPCRSKIAPQKGLSQKLGGWGKELIKTLERDDGHEIDETEYSLNEALEPSMEWVDVGSGSGGRLFLEVIGCDNFPKEDTSALLPLKNQANAYCCIIMEDSIVHTSIIPDSQSPRWMPSDRRAFIFHMSHPSSQVYVGVFDRDLDNRPGANLTPRVHDPLGRVVVNLSHFQPNTLYTLKYPLYLVDGEASRKREEQITNGTLTIRLRLEWGNSRCLGNDMKNMICSGMFPPPRWYVAVPTRNDFQTAYYTLEGDLDASKFSLSTLTSYVEELQSFFDDDFFEVLTSAILTVFLWRGTYPINCCCRVIRLPLHSIVAFTWGVLITHDYNLLPSFSFFAVGWFFLSTMEYRRQHPSPWHRCVSYGELLGSFLLGSFFGCLSPYGTGQTIEANENLTAIQEHDAAIEEHKKQKKEEEIQMAARSIEEDHEHVVDESATMETNVPVESANSNSFMAWLNPFKPIFHPVQKLLYRLLVHLRIIRSIIMWEESYYPFWMVTWSFLLSISLLFVRWGVILRWTFRVLVWAVLGPWMKLVDWLYFAPKEKMALEEKKENKREEIHNRYDHTLEDRLVNQKRREEAAKMKGMMKYLFGKFVLNVPRYREARFLDYPLPASTAEAFRSDHEDVETVGQICGQSLSGHMIPKRMVQDRPFSVGGENEGDDPLVVETETKPLLSQEKRGKKYGIF